MRLAALALPQQHELARRHWASDREFTLLLAGAGFGKELLGEIADRAVADAVLGPPASCRAREPSSRRWWSGDGPTWSTVRARSPGS